MSRTATRRDVGQACVECKDTIVPGDFVKVVEDADEEGTPIDEGVVHEDCYLETRW